MMNMLASARASVQRRCREFWSDIAVSAVVLALCVVALGIATAAAFGELRTITGGILAATILAGAYAAAAILIAAIRAMRRRTTRLLVKAAAQTQAGPADDPWRLGPDQVSAVETEALLMQALKLGSELSTTQLLLLALFGGFVTGRTIRK